MCYEYVDRYSNPISGLESQLVRNSNKTMIEELVLDLVSTIRETDPPLPDMSDPAVFKFYYKLHNREYK